MPIFPDVKPNDETITLQSSNQAYSSVLTGDTQSAELAGDRWSIRMQFSNRKGEEAAKLRAFIFSLGGRRTRFTYSPESIDNLGTAQGSGVVDGADQLGSTLATKGWDADQAALFKAGDYLEVNGELKMVTADVAAPQSYIEYTGTNFMPSPFDPSGWYGNTSEGTDTITNVAASNPSGSGFIGLATQVGTDQLVMSTNRYSQPISVVIGDRVVSALIVKSVDVYPLRVRFRFGDSLGFRGDAYYDTATNLLDGDGLVTNLGDGYFLVQAEWAVNRDDSSLYTEIFMWDQSGGSEAPIGSQLYVQAAFFGKADDWPANLLATANIPIAPKLRNSPPDGADIITTNPSATFRLEDDDQASFQVTGPVIYNASFALIEDF